MADRPCKLGADIMRQCYYQISLCFFPAHPDHNLGRNGRRKDTIVGCSQTLFFEQTLEITGEALMLPLPKMYLLLIHTFDCDILNYFSIETQGIKAQMTVLSK